MTIPLPIGTDRLLTRPCEPDDLGVLDRAATAALLEQYERDQAERGFSTWAVVEKAGGAVVSDVGFGVYTPTGEAELGYTLAAPVWGRGHGHEAARACGAAALAHLPARRLVAKVDPANERSPRLATGLGMQAVETIDFAGHPHVLLAQERA